MPSARISSMRTGTQLLREFLRPRRGIKGISPNLPFPTVSELLKYPAYVGTELLLAAKSSFNSLHYEPLAEPQTEAFCDSRQHTRARAYPVIRCAREKQNQTPSKKRCRLRVSEIETVFGVFIGVFVYCFVLFFFFCRFVSSCDEPRATGKWLFFFVDRLILFHGKTLDS